GQIKSRHACVSAIRNVGAFFGVALTGGDGDPDTALADRVLYQALRRGLSFKIGGGNVVTLCPPLTIGEAEFAMAFDILDRALEASLQGQEALSRDSRR